MSFPKLLSINEWRKLTSIKSSDEVEFQLRAIYESKTIYKRFDNLIKLWELCHKKTSESKHHETLALITIDIIGHILNETNYYDILKKIRQRKIIREYLPYFMPWKTLNFGEKTALEIYHSFKTTSSALKKAFHNYLKETVNNKNLLQVGGRNRDDNTYFWAYRSNIEDKIYNKVELEKFRLLPYQSKLIRLHTEGKENDETLSFLYADSSSLCIKAYHSLTGRKENITGTGIYTVHVNGSIFMGPSISPERLSHIRGTYAIQHTSYQDTYNGFRLFMAGEIVIIKGELVSFDGASGHYMPDYQQAQLAINYFEDLDLINNDTLLPYYKWNKELRKRSFHRSPQTKLNILLLDSYQQNVSLITEGFLKKSNKKLYLIYKIQSSINKEYLIWKKANIFSDIKQFKGFGILEEYLYKYSKKVYYDNPAKNIPYVKRIVRELTNLADSEEIKHKLKSFFIKSRDRIREILCFLNAYSFCMKQNKDNIPDSAFYILYNYFFNKKLIDMKKENWLDFRDEVNKICSVAPEFN